MSIDDFKQLINSIIPYTVEYKSSDTIWTNLYIDNVFVGRFVNHLIDDKTSKIETKKFAKLCLEYYNMTEKPLWLYPQFCWQYNLSTYIGAGLGTRY